MPASFFGVFIICFCGLVAGVSSWTDSMKCPNVPGGTSFQYTPGWCLYIRQEPIYKRDDAKKECHRLGHQQHLWRLPKLNTEEKQDKFNSAIQDITHKYEWVVWLDLTRDDPTTIERLNLSLWADSSKWRWSDNTTLKDNAFSPWANGEPNNDLNAPERCATSNQIGHWNESRWNDVPCDISAWEWYYKSILLLACETEVVQNSNNVIPLPTPAPAAIVITNLDDNQNLFWLVATLCLAVLVCAASIAGFRYWKQKRQINTKKNHF